MKVLALQHFGLENVFEKGCSHVVVVVESTWLLAIYDHSIYDQIEIHLPLLRRALDDGGDDDDVVVVVDHDLTWIKEKTLGVDYYNYCLFDSQKSTRKK